MVSEKSKANLKRGNPGRRKKSDGNQNAAGGKTWRDLIIEFGETQSDIDPTKTWKQLVVSAAYRQAALGNAPILRELMQRSEPQDIGIAHSGKLTIEIIEDGTITFTTPTRGAIANTE